jgi:hypothetical protein
MHGLSWQVLLFGKELASFAPLYEVFNVGHGRRPVESRRYALPTRLADAMWQPHSLL